MGSYVQPQQQMPYAQFWGGGAQQPPTNMMGGPGMGFGGGMPPAMGGLAAPPAEQAQQGPQGTSAAMPQQQLRPEDVKMIMETQALAPQKEQVQRQRKLADMMRAQASGGLKGQMVGPHYVKSNPLELVGNIAQSFAGAYGDSRANAASAMLGNKEGAINQEWLRRLMGQKSLEGTQAVPADWGG